MQSTVVKPDKSDAMPDLVGVSYAQVLSQIHKCLRPKSYLEIGTLTGETLALAQCPSIAVDPRFQINTNVATVKSSLHLYQMTSDDFFAAHNPSAIFGRTIDFAFLDGLHYFEYLLRDFANTERYCTRNSVIALHDCVPIDAHVGRRDMADRSFRDDSRRPDWWAGDVWKTVLALRRFRPDLIIDVFNAPPTGLAVITNLDPTSRTIQDNYFEIVREWAGRSIGEFGVQRLHDTLLIQPTDRFTTASAIAEHYWL